MHRNFVFDNIDHALPNLFNVLLKGGDEVGSRNGRVTELTHVGITLNRPTQREITVRGRKANLAAQIAETMWVLSGRNDIEFLSHYLPRAKDFSDDGKTWRGGYGPRLRAWKSKPAASMTSGDLVVDQVAYVADLLKKDALTRRAVIAIYDPAIDSADGKDIPCNDFIIFTNRNGVLDMAVTIRSNDLMWGWSGINAFEWSVLQELVAADVGIGVGALHFNIASLHLYQQHWKKGRDVSENSPVVPRNVQDSPRLKIPEGSTFNGLAQRWFHVEAQIRLGSLKTEHRADVLQDIYNFPEPMMQSWLRVLAWWWTADEVFLYPLANTRLYFATQEGLQPPQRVVTPKPPEEPRCPKCGTTMTTSGGRTPLKCIAAVCNYTPSEGEEKSFIDRVCDLHIEKDAAYGGSWKKRGELFSIIPNIARKVDRLGGAETSDETSADTAIDLFVYLAKYRMWLENPSTPVARVNALMREVSERTTLIRDSRPNETVTRILKHDFEELLGFVESRNKDAVRTIVNRMIDNAHELARRLDWQAHNQGRVWKGYDQ